MFLHQEDGSDEREHEASFMRENNSNRDTFSNGNLVPLFFQLLVPAGSSVLKSKLKSFMHSVNPDHTFLPQIASVFSELSTSPQPGI